MHGYSCNYSYSYRCFDKGPPVASLLMFQSSLYEHLYSYQTTQLCMFVICKHSKRYLQGSGTIHHACACTIGLSLYIMLQKFTYYAF